MNLGDVVIYTDHMGREHAAIVTEVASARLTLTVFAPWGSPYHADPRRGKPGERDTWHPRT